MNGLNNLYKKIFFLILLVLLTHCHKKDSNYDYTSILKNNPIINLYYFYSPGCADCDYVKNVIFPQIEKQNHVLLQVDYLNIDDPENLEKVLVNRFYLFIQPFMQNFLEKKLINTALMYIW
jgi:thiol-disulfide isomerase/thioredoxin